MKAFVCLSALLTISCGSGGDPTPSGSTSAGASAATSVTASARSAASTAATVGPSATATASAAPAGLTREEFCALAVKLGEENLATCAASEKANVASTDRVKDLATAGKECTMRVGSANVEFNPDVAMRCLEGAKKRGGKTTFFTFFLVPECSGVLTGKADAGAPVLFAEECAPGLAMLKNRCSKPVAKSSRCDDFPAGLLGKVEEHPRCQEGLDCFMTFGTSDGLPSEFACLPPADVGAPCKLDLNTCAQGSSCYQGKCRTRAGADGECMQVGDCLAEHDCVIKGGVFGKCVASPPLQTCPPSK